MQPDPNNRQPSLWSLIRRPWPDWARRAALFLGGQWVSMLGSSVVQFAILWYIQRSTDSGAMLAVGAVCAFLPQALIAPLAGVWADRYDRKKLAIGADAGIALATLALAALYMAGRGSLGWLFALSAVRGLGSGIQSPAVSAILPQLVPEQHLLRVNAANASAQSLILLLPPVIGAWMMSEAPMSAIFLLDVVTAAIGIGLFLRVKLPRHAGQETGETGRPWRGLYEGLRYTWRARPVRTLLGFYTLMMFLIVPVSMLTPLMVQRTFGMELWRLTAIEVAYGLGAMIGGGLIAAWGGWKNRARTLIIATALLGALTAALGLPMRFLGFLALMAVIGIWVPFYSTPCITLLQENADPAYMARVFSLVQMFSTLCLPLGMAVFGTLGDHLRIETLLLITGLAIAAMSAWMAATRALIQAGEPREPAREEG